MENIIEKADNFVMKLFKDKLPNTFIYHNYNHTQRVVKSTKELIENSQINVKEEQVLLLSAWLHDTGYTKTIKGHEEESVKIAKKFLEENKVDQETIKEVEKCILATKKEVVPETKLEEIIKDADASHLAKDYFEQAIQMMQLSNAVPDDFHLVSYNLLNEFILDNIEYTSDSLINPLSSKKHKGTIDDFANIFIIVNS